MESAVQADEGFEKEVPVTEQELAAMTTSLGATAKAVAPPQPSRRTKFRVTGPSAVMVPRPSQSDRGPTLSEWRAELAPPATKPKKGKRGKRSSHTMG